MRRTKIVCTIGTGATARNVARYRPRQPILAPTSREDTFRRLSLVWGVLPSFFRDIDVNEEMFEKALESIRRAGMEDGEGRIVVAGGAPGESAGMTHAIRVVEPD